MYLTFKNGNLWSLKIKNNSNTLKKNLNSLEKKFLNEKKNKKFPDFIIRDIFTSLQCLFNYVYLA